MIKDNEIRCNKCGTINNIDCKFCSNCGSDLNAVSKDIRPDCLASSIFMFVLSGISIILFIFSTLFIWLLGSSIKNSFLIVFYILFRCVQIISIVFGLITLILGIIAVKKTKSRK